GDDDELVALTLNNLGNLRWRQGLLTEAEAFHRRALTLRESLPEPDPVRIGDSANNLGVLLNALSRPQEAVPFFERALEAHAEAYGADHATTAVARNNLGIAALSLGYWDRAEAHFDRAADAWRRAYGAAHSRTLRAEFNAAQAIRWQGQLDEAVRVLHSVLERQERAEPPMPDEVGRTLSALGSLLTDLGDFAAAEEAVNRSVDLQLGLFGPEHRRTLLSRFSRARLWQRLGDDRGGPELEQLLALGEPVFGADSTYVASVLHELGAAAAASGDVGTARSLLSRAVDIRRRKLSATHPMRQLSERLLAELGT
ncbi:MAG: tetratricopeptide repeat protein, partial [Acidobacteriota bacterium]